jgi:GDP-L-fucose synthase
VHDIWENARILVTEPEGMIGRSLLRALHARDCSRILDSAGLDLSNADVVEHFFRSERPSHVFLAAGKKGGILSNQRYPAELMLDNLRVLTNVLEAALRHDVHRLLYLASACIYPRDCPQPMQEPALLTGPLETTNEAYSTAKLAGLKLCQAIRDQYRRSFIVAIPTNIYGPYDDFDPDNAHVVGALILKLSAAQEAGQREVVLWGTGLARREFLFSDDLGRACVFLMEKYDERDPINIGFGDDLSIRELADQIKHAVDYSGTIRFDATRPDGMPRKRLDSSRLRAMGWRPSVVLAAGLQTTCEWYARHHWMKDAAAAKERTCLSQSS